MEKTERQSNVELLRILAMLIIIGHHYVLHGGMADCTGAPFYNRIWIQFLLLGGKLGVSLFVLISGYFLVTANHLRIEKLLKLWLQVFTWSIICYGVYHVLMHRYTGQNQFLISDFVKCFFPLIFQSWWFASTYIALILFSPFLNRLLISLSQKQYRSFLLLMTACWGIVPLLFGKSFEVSHLLWFCYLYSIAGYIRLHRNPEVFPLSGPKCIALACLLLFFVLFVVDRCRILRLNLLQFREEYRYSFGEDGEQRFLLLLTVVAVLLFTGFLKCRIKHSRIINLISSSTFGVYLLHDSIHLRPALWSLVNGSHGDKYAYQLSFILRSVAVVLLVFAACMLIELLRITLLEKRYRNALGRAGARVEELLHKWNDSFDKADPMV